MTKAKRQRKRTFKVWVDHRNVADMTKEQPNTFFIVLFNPKNITTESAVEATLTPPKKKRSTL